ncbi:MAG: hypothetical protein FWF75_01460 [Propionibacteriaceae bacterium]|nr:hypothetical protein [Propionibacteriaceae bacterium]
MSYLSAYVGPLKCAAINAWMKQQGGTLYADERQWYFTAYNGNTFGVTQPDADGTGGGEAHGHGLWLEFADEEVSVSAYTQRYTAAYTEICSRIDGVLDGFDDIPDGSVFDASIDDMGKLMAELTAPDSTTSGGGSAFSSAWTTLSNVLINSTDGMSGQTVAAFNRFINGLPMVIGNFGAVVTALCASMSGERMLYEKAQADVVRLVKNATADFAAYAALPPPGFSADWSSVFGVVEALLDGAAVIFPEAAIPLGVTSMVVKIVDDVSDGAPKQPSAPVAATYDDTLAALIGGLADMNSAFRQEEDGGRQAMVDNVGLITSNDGGSFKLGDPLGSVDTPNEFGTSAQVTLAVSEGQRDSICLQLQDIVDTVVSPAKAQLYDQVLSAPWIRPANIGLSPTGYLPQWADVAWCLYDCLGDLANDLADVKQRFYLAVTAIIDNDTDAASQLSQYAAQMDPQIASGDQSEIPSWLHQHTPGGIGGY